MKSVRYQIHTENKNLDGLLDLVAANFDGFNYVTNVGAWKGTFENSITFSIVNSERFLPKIVKLCEKIKLLNGQEAVLLTVEPIEARLI